jgi:hypothetical protein
VNSINISGNRRDVSNLQRITYMHIKEGVGNVHNIHFHSGIIAAYLQPVIYPFLFSVGTSFHYTLMHMRP